VSAEEEELGVRLSAGLDLNFVGPALRWMRLRVGLLQADVSRRSGLTRSMVSAYEAGKSVPSLGSLSVYLGAIGRNLRDLQDEIDRLSGKAVQAVEDRERAVGRAAMKAMENLGFGSREVE